jgi:starch phosphorylase
MKLSMQTLGPIFNTNRMIEEYTEKFYVPTAIEHKKLKENNFELAKKKVEWLNNIRNNWNSVKFILVSDNTSDKNIKISDSIAVQVKIYLGSITPDDVSVQVYSGCLDGKQAMTSPSIDEMHLASKEGNDYIFEGKILVEKVGECGYTIRVLPKYQGKIEYIPEIIKWM